ncbi:LacI family DNA-binding transcriptional regulator [Leadbettera azotonutricia]|uniref:Transcriptional repressor of the ribose operon n=1 Tax=Leadbettera azotonutricia (strain ATCC BAA-888 / DSM 13862 / ZAS-9) TaxID=545695 RepID=F5Y885_LEAAZ|nr:LacI family DNA-binding transcriptional regulator [Leadbettera azotonutricia]AEF80678.1 transcriptional repressor of the ribose operon [Leadbettera azotonutricia ZAS-9]
MITIHDVAKRAGVSISTVSNVINKNKFVSDDLARRVNAAVQELKYTANPIAQKMKIKHTKTIGIITADLCGLFYPYVLKGMYDVLNTRGYRLNIMDNEGSHDSLGGIKKFQESIDGLIRDRMDGIVFASTVPEEIEAGIIRDIMSLPSFRRSTGFVCIEKNISKYGIDSVFADSETGAKMAVNHLIETGCRRIGHITGPFFVTIVQDRVNGYKKVMKNHGFEVDDNSMIARGDYTHKSGYLAMKDLLRKMPDLDGVFVANDQMSVGAMKALSEAGKRIPEDVKIIGYDDVFISSVLEPSLSTIHVQKYRMGKNAAELLLAQIEGEKEISSEGTAIELEPKLVVRRSTVKNAPDDWILVDW